MVLEVMAFINAVFKYLFECESLESSHRPERLQWGLQGQLDDGKETPGALQEMIHNAICVGFFYEQGCQHLLVSHCPRSGQVQT